VRQLDEDVGQGGLDGRGCHRVRWDVCVQVEVLLRGGVIACTAVVSVMRNVAECAHRGIVPSDRELSERGVAEGVRDIRNLHPVATAACLRRTIENEDNPKCIGTQPREA
jgi:hypothetical protein